MDKINRNIGRLKSTELTGCSRPKMDTSAGLQKEIADIEKERGYGILISCWKELDKKGGCKC